MGFTFDSSRLNLQGVQSIIISTIQADTASTQYVRLIQLYTDPPDTPNRRPILELALYGGDQTTNDMGALEIQVPGGLEF